MLLVVVGVNFILGRFKLKGGNVLFLIIENLLCSLNLLDECICVLIIDMIICIYVM